MRDVGPELSVVIPIYNEEINLDILYKEIRESVDRLGFPYEVIFINDGSSDGSLERLKDIKKREMASEINKFVQIRIISFTRNYGQTNAMQAGFDYAAGEIIITMDGDLQNDPGDIPRLIDRLKKGYDIVSGWRKNRQDKTLSRVIPSKLANWLIAKITGVQIHDNGCSLKAYRSSVIKSVYLYSDMHRFIPAITTIVGARISEIIVNHRPRMHGKSKYGISRTWKVLFDMTTIKMLIHFYYRPIVWFASLGTVSLLIAFLFAIASVYLLFNGEKTLIFGTSSFLFLALFGGFLSWGLLAEFFIKIKNPRGFYDNYISHSTTTD